MTPMKVIPAVSAVPEPNVNLPDNVMIPQTISLMTAPTEAENGNRRILIIDDMASIHEDFRKILLPAAAGGDDLSASETSLFGSPSIPRAANAFEIDSAYQGKDGYELVERALAEENPYAMAFIDVRMPPGWDGLETVKRIHEVDPRIQVVICTAYSDYTWEEIFEIIGIHDGLVILKKPFDPVEAMQLATSMTEKWRLHRQTERQMELLEQRVAERTEELVTKNRDLEAAIHEIRTLQGLLPICAGCRKIRDEKEAWTSLEAYVESHTEARFSHGLCPDCEANYMAELDSLTEDPEET